MKELNEKEMKELSGGIMCGDGVDRDFSYNNWAASDCPKCHCNGTNTRLSNNGGYGAGAVWGYCKKCNITWKVYD